MSVDAAYFEKKLRLVLRDLESYSPEELGRELLRLSVTANPATEELTARIAELETANKGLQIALLDANEKEKELQLRNAMLADELNVANNDSKLWDGHEGRYSKVINATSAQSAAWLENSHREWMKTLPVAVYGLPTVPVRYVDHPDFNANYGGTISEYRAIPKGD